MVIDSDVCCAVGKCVRSAGYGAAYAGANNFLALSGPSMSSQYGYGSDGDSKVRAINPNRPGGWHNVPQNFH